ncbi:hypothetical protein QJS66_12635 [Kocuria rhizophila]|nr:hypothetical protein QJS66_12635 [Kocuria rhizophila]
MAEQIRRCDRAEDPRGLGATPSSLHVPAGGGRDDVEVAIHTDTLNEAGFVGGHPCGDRRAGDPHVPHRGRRWPGTPRTSSSWRRTRTSSRRPRTPRCRTRATPSRSTWTCHGVPPPQPWTFPRMWRSRTRASARRPLRREDALQDMVLHHLLGLAGDGPVAGGAVHVEVRGTPTEPARAAARGRGHGGITTASSATSPSTRSTRAIAHGISHVVGSVEEASSRTSCWAAHVFGAKPDRSSRAVRWCTV